MNEIVVLVSFQEASKHMLASETLVKTLENCLSADNYVEIASDYVGSILVQPIQILVFASKEMIKEKRIKKIQWNQQKRLKEGQVGLHLDQNTSVLFMMLFIVFF